MYDVQNLNSLLLHVDIELSQYYLLKKERPYLPPLKCHDTFDENQLIINTRSYF